MSSGLGLTRAEMHDMRRRKYQARNGGRPLRPPPKVNVDTISPHRSPPPVKQYKPVTHNNINPVPSIPPHHNHDENVPPSTTIPTPAYLLAPFGVSGTVAPNPRAEERIRMETNVPPDVRGTLRGAKTESTQIGAHHGAGNTGSPPAPAGATNKGQNETESSKGGNAAPAEGSNPDFDAKVRLLQQRLQSGGDISTISTVVDGSSVGNVVDPFEAEVQREMDRLQTEVIQEMKSTEHDRSKAEQVPEQEVQEDYNNNPPMFPSEMPKSSDNYGAQLRQQIESDARARDLRSRSVPSTDNSSSPAMFPSEMSNVRSNGNYGDLLREQMESDMARRNRAVRGGGNGTSNGIPSAAAQVAFPSEVQHGRRSKDNNYGAQLREQMESDARVKAGRGEDELRGEYEVKKRDLERQRNAITGRREYQRRVEEEQREVLEERRKQQEYKVTLDRQIQDKRNKEIQDKIEDRYSAPTSFPMPSEKSTQMSPSSRRSQLRRNNQVPSPPQEAQSKRQDLVDRYKDQSKMEEEFIKREAEKRRRVKSAQEGRMKEERDAVMEKNRAQNEYLEALKRQQEEQEIIRRRELEIERNEPPGVAMHFQSGEEGRGGNSNRNNNNNINNLYAQQLQEQIFQKQQALNPPSPNNQTPAYLQSPSKQNVHRHRPQARPPITNYGSPRRVPPHKTPPVSPRYFPSEQPVQSVEKFGQGLSTLYTAPEPNRQQQMQQTKKEYRRYLEQQIRDKEQRSMQSRISDLSQERSLLSPDLNAVPVKPYVSPAYADHLSPFDPNNGPASSAAYSYSPRPVVQHQPTTTNSPAASKAQYAAQLREQMRANEEKKMRLKREQKEYDAKYDSPPKPTQQQQLMSPDEYVDGPFGRRRLGGGGDPGGVADLKKRSNLIRQISNDEVEATPRIYENAPEPPTPAGANAATRRKMVADVYGATGAGAALGFAAGVPAGNSRPAKAQAAAFPSFSNPNPPDAKHMSAAETQRNALQMQIEEKRRKKEEEERKEKEEDAKEWMRIQMENERLKEEKDAEKRKKQLEEQRNLELLQAQQEAAALKRMNRKNEMQAPEAQPQSARGGPPSVRPPPTVRPPSYQPTLLGSAREATPHTSRSNQGPPQTMRETQQQAAMDKIMAQRSPLPAQGNPYLRPGDFFTIDPNEMVRESSPFTKNMELLRSSVEDDYSQPLTDFQKQLKSDVGRFSSDLRPPPAWDDNSRPPVYTGNNDEDQLEQSLRADSQFHIVPREGQMPFGQTMMGGGSVDGGSTSASLMEDLPDAGKTEVDLSDAFVQQWQADNGFSSATGGYAPHRKLLAGALDQGKMPNFRALNAMTSKRNFANGNKESIAAMTSTAAPPVNPNDALRRTMIPQEEEGGGTDLTSKSDFFNDDVANVADVFGGGVRRNRNDPVEMSLKSDSLLMYLKGPESNREKEATRYAKELQSVGEEAGENGGVGEASVDDSGPTSEQFGRSGFVVREQRDVVRVEGSGSGGRYQEEYEDDFADDCIEDMDDLGDNEEEVLVVSGGSGSGSLEAKVGAPSFSVNSVTDEEREMMMDQQRSKWGQPDPADDIRAKMADVGERDDEAVEEFPRSNSELDVMAKLKRMEEDLGVGAGSEVVEEDVVNESSSSGEVVEEVGEEGGGRRKSFTEKWLGIDKKDDEENKDPAKLRSKFNAELIFVNDEEEGKKGKEEEEEEEYSDDEDDGEISPPSSPTKAAAPPPLIDVDDYEDEDEEEISPPSSPTKLNQSDPGDGIGDLTPVDKQMVEDLVNSYIKGGLKDLEDVENEDDDLALGEALMRVKSKANQSVEVD